MDIFTLRKKIDKIDSQIIELLNKRADIALLIGMTKKDKNISVVHSDREEEILQRMVIANKGPLSAADVRKIYSVIIKICRGIQNRHLRE